MFRSLVILTLVAAQLLVGSAGAAFLCVCNGDNSVCICAGPDACTCCRDQDRRDSDRSDSCGENRSCPANSKCSCAGCDEESIEDASLSDVRNAPCGCTYFPIMVESDQPNTVSRSAILETLEQCSALFALPSGLADRDLVVARPARCSWYHESVAPDFLLTVISTVVIRC